MTPPESPDVLVQHRGLLYLDQPLLVERLQLPPGTVILDARYSWLYGGQLELVIAHPSLERCETGTQPRVVTLRVESRYHW